MIRPTLFVVVHGLLACGAQTVFPGGDGDGDADTDADGKPDEDVLDDVDSASDEEMGSDSADDEAEDGGDVEGGVTESDGADDESETDVPIEVDPTRLQSAAVNANLAVGFSLSADGAGANLVDDFLFTNAKGSLMFAGVTYPAVIYERILWENYGYILFQGIGVSAEEWIVFWLYCTTSNQAAWLWYEGTHGPAIAAEAVSGPCSSSTSGTTTTLSLPSTDMPMPLLIDDFAISGTDLSLVAGQAGSFVIGDVDHSFFPFGHVDCTSCGGGGWHELHSLFRREDFAEAGFTIFYLFNADHGTINNAYTLRLPDLVDPLGDNWTPATWSLAP